MIVWYVISAISLPLLVTIRDQPLLSISKMYLIINHYLKEIMRNDH